MKGGVNPPKIFNRLKQVDSPERMLTYMDEESYDAICFIPQKDIKFAGFSVYQVFAVGVEPKDFTCIY